MENNDYDKILQDLNNKVSKFSKTEIMIDKTSLFYNINPSFIYYGLIPFFIFIFLYIIRPRFVMSTKVSIDNQLFLEKKLNYKKLFVSTFIISIFIWIAIYSYQYKQKLKN